MDLFGPRTRNRRNPQNRDRNHGRDVADRVKATVVFANKGTAPAYNLQVHLTALGLTDASPVVAHLDPGQSDRALFEREIRGAGKGRYPMTVRVDFTMPISIPFPRFQE